MQSHPLRRTSFGQYQPHISLKIGDNPPLQWRRNRSSCSGFEKNSPRCYAKSPIPGLISCAGVTGRWGLLSHAQNVVKWLALSKRSAEALRAAVLRAAVFHSKIVIVMCCRCTNVCVLAHIQKCWRYRKYYPCVANKSFWLLSQHWMFDAVKAVYHSG